MSEEKTKKKMDEVRGCFIGEPRTATVGKGKAAGRIRFNNGSKYSVARVL